MIRNICTKCGEKKIETEFAIKYKERNKRSNICKKCHRIYTAKHYRDNREKCLNYHKERKQKLRNKVLTLYGDKCSNCGCDEKSILELNHVNADGCIERKEKKMHSYKIYQEALKQDGRYNILCKVCNIQHYVEVGLGIKGFKVTYTGIF